MRLPCVHSKASVAAWQNSRLQTNDIFVGREWDYSYRYDNYCGRIVLTLYRPVYLVSYITFRKWLSLMSEAKKTLFAQPTELHFFLGSASKSWRFYHPKVSWTLYLHNTTLLWTVCACVCVWGGGKPCSAQPPQTKGGEGAWLCSYNNSVYLSRIQMKSK